MPHRLLREAIVVFIADSSFAVLAMLTAYDQQDILNQRLRSWKYLKEDSGTLSNYS